MGNAANRFRTNNTNTVHNDGTIVQTNPNTTANRTGFLSNFGRSSGPKGTYAEKANQHTALQPGATYSLQNVDTILGRQVRSNYPVGEGQIYNIKQYNATYQGAFSKGFPTGPGVAYFKDGGYYSGNFVNGDAEGTGLYIYPNGSVYEGHFANSQYNGQGQLVYADQRLKYQGNFLNGLPHGKGRETYGDGSFYEGDFANGAKHGLGTYQWANGQRYEGSFVEGLMQGRGQITRNGQIVYSGEFVKGLKSGYGVYRTQNGSYEGNFQNDLLNGNGTFIWNDGKVYDGNFYNSQMHGQGTIYYPTNQIADGEWELNHNKILSRIRNDPLAGERIREIRTRHENTSGKQSLNNSQDSSFRNDSNFVNNRQGSFKYQQPQQDRSFDNDNISGVYRQTNNQSNQNSFVLNNNSNADVSYRNSNNNLAYN